MSSPSTPKAVPSRWEGLPLALLLAVLFLLLSYVRILGDTQSMGFRSNVLKSIFAGDIWGSVLMWNILWFVLGLLLLHVMLGLACWGVAKATRVAWPTAQLTIHLAVLAWFMGAVLALFASNAANFPRSSLGGPYALTMMKPVAGVMLGNWIALLVLGAAAVTLVMSALRRWRAGARPGRGSAILAACVAALGLAILLANRVPARGPTASRPNIILIGIDSLRHDMIAPQTSPRAAPHIEDFLQGATRFDNAITPLARTFPSMMSILTGRHPHRTGAVINLLPRDLIREGDTLGRILGREGYFSAYAMDEVRFANIDESYGFDTTVSPPIGASEFLLSMFADTPLFNPVVNTTVGRWLFPHIHANRGAATTYDPDTFVDRIEREMQWKQPVFLATHLTLPHWPYVWFDAPVTPPVRERTMTERWPEYYLNVIRRVDAQFARLMTVLERQGVLENAVVVLYSDHGEAFGNPRESMVPEGDALVREFQAYPQWGHGNSVLSPHQYHVVLGIRGFGAMADRTRDLSVSAPVSVLDIAPTMLELAGIQTATPFDGSSMVPLLKSDPAAADAFRRRTRFTETEYAPTLSAENGKLNSSELLKAAEIYRVNTETDRVEVRRDQTKTLLSVRQYAALGEQWLVAAIPRWRPGDASHRFLFVAVSGGFPQRIEGAPGANVPEEVRRLWRDLHREFGDSLPPLTGPDAVADAPVAGNTQRVTPSVTK